MVTARSEELELLLDVQRHDTALDRLRRHRAELDERSLLVELASARSVVAQRVAEADRELKGVEAEERRLDDEVRAIEAKASEVERHLYDGTVTSPRELQDLQADLDQLRARQRHLEDDELTQMEQREALGGGRSEVGDELSQLDARIAETERALQVAEAGIDSEVETELAARSSLTARINEALVADYERRRDRNRGTGIARLVGGSCQACGLSIPAVEVDRFRRAEPGTLCSPDDCECILVAT